VRGAHNRKTKEKRATPSLGAEDPRGTDGKHKEKEVAWQ
jgi:hypothetical protein